jgi:uncharacterized integral membrane protein
MRTLVTFLVMLFFFALGVFVFQNTHGVSLRYFSNAVEAPLWLVVIIAVMTGLFFAVVIQALERAGSSRETRLLEEEVEELRHEMDRMRRGGGGA